MLKIPKKVKNLKKGQRGTGTEAQRGWSPPEGDEKSMKKVKNDCGFC